MCIADQLHGNGSLSEASLRFDNRPGLFAQKQLPIHDYDNAVVWRVRAAKHEERVAAGEHVIVEPVLPL